MTLADRKNTHGQNRTLTDRTGHSLLEHDIQGQNRTLTDRTGHSLLEHITAHNGYFKP